MKSVTGLFAPHCCENYAGGHRIAERDMPVNNSRPKGDRPLLAASSSFQKLFTASITIETGRIARLHGHVSFGAFFECVLEHVSGNEGVVEREQKT